MKVKTITISAKEAVAYMENTNALFKALWELTDMLKLESELKKRHRAYLHVRENIDEKVKDARVLMNKVSMDTLKSSFVGNESEEAPDCDNCVCSKCPHDCLKCKDASCFEDKDENYPFAEADEDTHLAVDYGDSGKPIIISQQQYDDMVDDLLSMAELIDMVCDMRTADEKELHKLARFIPAFADYERNRLSLYRDAAKEAESIMDRWEDAFEPDEYYSD